MGDQQVKDSSILLFDLDGTLTDPKIGIVNSVAFSLSHFGIKIEDTDELTAFIGPPLRDTYKTRFLFSDSQVETAVEKYREYYAGCGIYENTLYCGIDALLRGLRFKGKTIALATSKPEVYAEQILEYFDIRQYFDFVAGSELDGRRSGKEELIRYALSRLNVADNRAAAMVGDRNYDIIGAKSAGIVGIGVLYGYGEKAELIAAGADYIAEDVPGLSELLLGGCK